MFKPLRSMLRDPETKVIAMSALVTISVGSLFYMWNEGWTPVQAVYFCVVTLATVGFGDLHPTNELSQLFTIGYILAGIGIIAAFATELAKHRSAGRTVERDLEAVEEHLGNEIKRAHRDRR